MLIRIGAYVKGSDSELDEAIDKKEMMEKFLKQKSDNQTNYEETIETLISIVK